MFLKIISVSAYVTYDHATAETPSFFKDLQQRPRPVDLIGVTDEEIVSAARKSSLAVDDEHLKGYWHNLQGALPYYEDVIRTLLRDYQGYSYVFLGRDAEPLYDAMASTLQGTGHEKDAILLPLSSQLISKFSDYHTKTRHFLGQYIDFKAAWEKEKKYVVVDTGSVGTSIVWLNGWVSGSHDTITDILEDEAEVNGAPLYGLLIQAAKARHMFGDVPGRQLYPQVKLEVGKNRFAPEDFRVPQSVRDLARKQYDINFVVASVTQLMPKYTGHVDDLREEVGGERNILCPVSSEKASDQLLQVEDVILKSNDPFRRGGLLTWHSPINPVAATRIQCAVVNYFASHRSQIYGG